MLREIRLTGFKLDEAGNMVKAKEKVLDEAGNEVLQESVYWKSNTCWICENFKTKKDKRPSHTYEDFYGLRSHFKRQHVERWPCVHCNQPQASEAQLKVMYYNISIWGVKILGSVYW